MKLPFRQGHSGPVNGLTFAADGRRLISCGEDGDLRLWDAAGGGLLDRLSCDAIPLCVAALPDGADGLAGVLVGDGAGRLQRYAWGETGFVRPGVLLGALRGAVLALAISPDGAYAAAATDTWAVVVWDLGTGKRRHILAGHRAAVLALAFLPGGAALLSADEQGELRLWDLSTATGRRVASFAGAVETLAVRPDGEQVAVGLESGRTHLLSLPAPAFLGEWDGHNGWVAGVVFSTNGTRLLSAAGDGTVCVRRVPEGEVIVRQEFGVAFSRLVSAQNGVVALGDEAGGVRVLEYS